MAHHNQLLSGDPDAFLSHLDSTIRSGSVTAHREHAVEHKVGDEAAIDLDEYERDAEGNWQAGSSGSAADRRF